MDILLFNIGPLLGPVLSLLLMLIMIFGMSTFSYPGVKVTEATRGAIPIDRVAFRNGKFVGTALRGPVNQVVTCTKLAQYHAIFGKRSAASYMDDAAKAWFENVDAPAEFVRVVGATGALKASSTLVNGEDDVLLIESWGPGASYNSITYTYVDGTLTLFDNAQGGQLIEQYQDIVFGRSVQSADWIEGQSTTIRITWLDNTQNPTNVSVATALAGGADGASVTSTQVIGVESQLTGIYAYARKELPLGFLMAPGYSAQTVGNALISVAERFRLLALIDSTFGNSISQAKTERNQYASSFGYALYCYGWCKVPDSETGALIWVPRSPFKAAHIVRSHEQPGGLANVGAGLDYILRNVVAIENGAMTDLDQGEINIKGIDVARNFGAFGQGIVHWAARTISTNTLYRFLSVRVIFNVIAESVELGLKPYIFRPIDGKGRLAGEIQGSIDQLLWGMWQDGALFGDTAEEAFKTYINTQDLSQLEAGVLEIEIYAKPTPVVERIAVTLYRVPLSFNFRTGQVTVGTIEEVAA